MTCRCRLAVTVVTLAMQVLAPIGAHAAKVVAASPGDYCSGAARAAIGWHESLLVLSRGTAADSSTPAPRPVHSSHFHCPSCAAVSLAVAMPASKMPLTVQLQRLVRATTGSARADTASQFALLPPLRGPPRILV